jgi:ABC-2 type transport system permease protein
VETKAVISGPLLKQIVKSNFKLFIVLTGVACVLLLIILIVFTPSTMESIAASSGNMPFNPLGNISTLIDFLANQYFGMMALILPMIYVIAVGNKMIAGQVDAGSMAYNLSAPVTRTQVTFANALFLCGSLAAMFGFIAGVGIGAASVIQPGILNNNAFLRLALGDFALQFAITGIVFCSSCIFNRSSRSLILGAGLPVLFFVANLMVGMSKDLEFFKYFSLISLFDKDALIQGAGYLPGVALLIGLGLALAGAGMKVFKEKDLPL